MRITFNSRNGQQLGQHSGALSAVSQAQDREGTMSLESFGKPDAMKVARPVWGLGSECSFPADTTVNR